MIKHLNILVCQCQEVKISYFLTKFEDKLQYTALILIFTIKLLWADKQL